MDALRELLLKSQPLLLFLIIALGFLLGQIRYRGISLGVAGVLFVGLMFGMWQPAGAPPLAIAHEVSEIGLILFVYAVGLTSGPGFFDSLRQRGVRFNLAVVASLVLGAILALGLGTWMRLPASHIAGVFCGGLTNTPALAAVTELLKGTDPERAADATVGYSIAYPFGVIGGLFAFQVFAWIHRARLKEEKDQAAARLSGEQKVVARNFEIRNPELFNKAIGELRIQEETGLIISRLRHGDNILVPTKYTLLQEGDVVVAVGKQGDMGRAKEYFGAESSEHLEASRERIEMRRILVSRRELAGRTVEELELDRRFNAQITRLRRADFDMVPSPDTVLELGDRLRVVMPREKAGEVARYFGDSERHLAELDYTAITLGISLGVLLGMIPLPFPGETRVTLGFAGGPLLAGLVLGKLGRTGPVVWSIPLESNQALRHIGLLFFLAGVGVTAGGRFLQAVSASGVQLFILGVLVTAVTTALTMFLLRVFAGASIIGTMGAASGMQTQPATLAKAYEISGSDETYIAYATTYPIAMVGKILLAQAMVILGGRLF